MTNSVTFPTILGGSGITYTDDSTAPYGLGNGLHRLNFLNILSQEVIMAQSAATNATASAASATAAATSAASALAAPGTNGTSTTSLAIATGSKSFTTQSGKSWVVGMWMIAADSTTPANYMFGQVTSYSSTTLVLNVTQVGGSGTLASWNISLSGPLNNTVINGNVVNQSKGADIASAGTTNIETATGNYVHITGTTGITAFTLTAGHERVLTFDGALTLTHNASSLILPGGADITTAAGDSCIVRAETTNNVRVTSYTKAVVPPGSINTTRSDRSSNTILGLADRGRFIRVTSGTFTQTFTAAATLGNGWYCYIQNDGTGDVTLDPNSSELIDTLTSYIMYPGESRLIMCDGSAFTSVVLHGYRRDFTSSGTWTKPPGYKTHGGLAWSGGAGGEKAGSGSTTAVGGGGGGCFPFLLNSYDLGTTETITIGSGGAARTTTSTGGVGGDTTFGSWFTVFGASAAGSSVCLGGSIGATGRVNSSTPVGFEGTLGNSGVAPSIYGGSASSTNGTSNSSLSVYGGAAGASIDSANNVRTAGTSKFGGNGGAASAASSGTDGTAPAGGGGATQTGTTSGAGARGELRIHGVV